MTSFMSIGRYRISRLSVTLLPLSLGNLWESCARQYSSYSNSRDCKILTVSSINQNLVKLRYEIRGTVAKRADEIRKDLKKSGAWPFSRVVEPNIGNPHAMKQIPITFFRQVLALCMDKTLLCLEALRYPSDVKERANHILDCLEGHGIGAYTASVGVTEFRKNIAKFIEERDGYSADYRNIFLINGASDGIRSFLALCVLGSTNPSAPKVGYMSPVPQYPLYSACFAELGAEMIPYYLDEDNNWQLNIEDLGQAVQSARLKCEPRVLVVINPGNPTGQVLSRSNMEDIIRFCHTQRLVLLVDEVYQENVYDDNCEFISFKKVLKSMGPEYDNMELVSFHSTSKGYIGECGIRGGYMEMVGISSDVMETLERYMSSKLCANTVGQIMTDLMIHPPNPGDESFPQFDKERSDILTSLKRKAKLISERLDKIKGIKCNAVQGGMYAFPRIFLPSEAIAKAKRENMEPDEYYCLKLLEEHGTSFVPGSGFGQIEGTYHFRTSILPDESTTVEMLDRVEEFHKNFLIEHSHGTKQDSVI